MTPPSGYDTVRMRPPGDEDLGGTRLGIAMQRGNAAAVRGTLPQTDCPS